MTGMQWALLLKPLGVFIFMAVLIAPIKVAIWRLMPDSPLKQLLFKRIN
mgnify:FL=1